jgi:DNA-directed RNA polymerase I, II, and III subunit RPABC2
MSDQNDQNAQEVVINSDDIAQVGGAPKRQLTITKKKTPTNPESILAKPKTTSKTSKPKSSSSVSVKDAKDAKDAKDEKIEGNEEVLLDTSKISTKTKKPSKKTDTETDMLFNGDEMDYRQLMMNYDPKKNKTLAKITKYELALLIGKRAKQIECGANPNVKVLPGQSAIEIAEEELRQRKIPLIIKRPVGDHFEYWRPADMEVVMD